MKQQNHKSLATAQARGFWRGTRTFYKLVASFLLMLIIPFLTLLANYLYARQLLQEENLNYQNAVLVQVQKMVDERLQSLQLFAIDISNDTTVNNFLESDTLSGRDLNIRVWEISQHIKTYTASYRDLSKCIIYSVNYDYLITAEGADSEVSKRMIRMDSAQLNRLLQEQLQQKKLYCSYQLLQDDAGNSALVMLHSVPLWSTGRKATGAICLLIDTDQLFYNIKTMEELQPGLVCLLNENNQPLATAGNQALLASLSDVLANGEGFTELNGVPYTVSMEQSAIGGWRYLSVQPEHTMLGKLQRTRNLSLTLLMLSLGLGIVSAYLLSRRNYKPVENLMHALRKQSIILKERADGDESEFHLIERSVADITKSMAAVQGVLREELPRIQESILMQLLKNAVTDYAAFQDTLESMGILLPYDTFAVAVVRRIAPEPMSMEAQAISNVVVKEQLMALIPREITHTVVMPQSDVLVILLNGKAEHFSPALRAALLRLLERTRDDFSQMLSICLSRAVTGLERVPHAFYTAMQTQNPSPSGGLFELPEQNGQRRLEQCLEEISSLLQNYIATGNEDSALALLRQTTAENLNGKNLELYYVRGYFISLLNLMKNAYPIDNADFLSIENTDPLQLLFLQEAPAQMMQTVETVVRRLCEHVQKNQKGHASQMIEQVLSFVQQEYANPDLTLTYVAEHFYITPSYLSTFFKENAGDTFLNYLTRFRLDKAKELIRTTNLPMGDIAAAVGYASGNTFTRIFKKAEHITPTQYRDSMHTTPFNL